jgi:hypothetical protein
MNQLDLDWSNEGFHKLAVTFAYTRWQNNSVQNLVQNILQEGLSTVVNSVFGSSLNL